MRKLYLFLIVLLFFNTAYSQPHNNILLDKGWKFILGDDDRYSSATFDDSSWASVRLPHDWAIYGPFSSENDKQSMAVVQDGQTTEVGHTGRTGGLPHTGTGWYRIRIERSLYQEGQRIFLLFDGAMSNSTVYVNGNKVGNWPNGYNSFWYDITEFCGTDSDPVVAVRLDNEPESSRWYPGAGLYRNVHLIIKNRTYIPVWGSRLTTPFVSRDYARIEVETDVIYGSEASKLDGYCLKSEVLDGDGKVICEKATPLSMMKYNEGRISQSFVVENPELWDLDTPYLYTLKSELTDECGMIQDESSIKFGIRDFRIDSKEGVLLNGSPLKFRGVCLHHDLGPLGGAVNRSAINRQLRIMKDMGCNAIRTAHNMPSPELIEACDEMGLMVMAESFDEWDEPKMANGYNKYFKDWAEKDLCNLIRRYRNHPSIVMWSIGNEVPNQWNEDGCKRVKYLQDICHREDPTRTVTVGMDMPKAVLKNNFAAVIDVPGFNYRPYLYQSNHEQLPHPYLLGTETASTVSSRGVYKFPAEKKAMAVYDDNQSSSYDLEYCNWSNLPEDDFIQHEDLPYTLGEFVWTGFDYLGEPTPYYTNWPSHSSLFGIVDLAGIPKDRYYLYRSHWNPSVETLHILPHWNWEGREGQTTPVFVYTNYPSVELFINGKSQGIRTKNKNISLEEAAESNKVPDFSLQERYRLMWMDTEYEPGEVTAVAYGSDGKIKARKTIRTAGKPYKIELSPDRALLNADGKDLAFINVRLVDKEGNFCPCETRKIRFKVKGAGHFKAIANGDPTCLESFQNAEMSLFSGQLTMIVETDEQPGEIIVEAFADGVRKEKIKLTTKEIAR